MSALPPKADIDERDCHVRFVPKADVSMQQDALTELLLNYSRPATRVCRDRDVGVWCNLQVLALSTEYS
jgi:hypothetical protein